MGLSDGERYTKIVYALQGITKLDILDKEIKKLIGKLWPSFLNQTSNSGHWIFGSESSATNFGECSLLNVAFQKAKYDSLPKNPNAFTWPEIETFNLLDSEDKEIWELLKWIEQYFYAVNRYKDEFSAALKKTTNIISKIRGKLQTYLSKRSFCLAWMTNNLLYQAIKYKDDDDVVKYLVEEYYLRHYITLNHCKNPEDFKFIYDTFCSWQKSKKISAKKRLDLILFLAPSFPGNYIDEQAVLGVISEWNEREPKDKINLNSIVEFFAKKLKHEMPRPKNYCYFTKQEI